MTTLEHSFSSGTDIGYSKRDAERLGALLGDVLDRNGSGAATDIIRAFTLGHPHIGAALDEAYPSAASLVHLEQEITLHAPLHPGTAYRVEPALAGSRPLRDDTVAGLETTVREAATGKLVATLQGSVLLGAVDPVGDTPTPIRRAGAPPLPSEPPVRARVHVTDQFVRDYADLSDDHNQIHLDDQVAAAAGFPRRIAHGMSVVGLVTGEAAARAETANGQARVAAVSVRFAQPVLVEDEVDIVLQATDDPYELRVSAASPRGPVLKAGWVRFETPVRLKDTARADRAS